MKLDLGQDWFLIGQVLAEGEQPATSAPALPLPQQRALTLCLKAERLDYCRRLGWQHPKGSQRVMSRTVDALVRDGLMVIVRRSQFKRHARLTSRGDWYARTLVTDLMARVRSIIAETGEASA
jgi:hypothetical protein